MSLCRLTRFVYCYAECYYAECHYAEGRYAECHYAECRYAVCRGAELQPCLIFEGKVRSIKGAPLG
jgi:hypothetical protein